VLPEYILATRYGYGTYTGAQMAAFHLTSGVVFVAIVSRFVLARISSFNSLVRLLAVACC
jgi:hypothetical protein